MAEADPDPGSGTGARPPCPALAKWQEAPLCAQGFHFQQLIQEPRNASWLVFIPVVSGYSKEWGDRTASEGK